MGDAPATTAQVTLGPFARRPAVSAAAFLILGILLHRTLPDLPRAWAALAAAGALVTIACPRFGLVSTFALSSSLFLLGATVGQLERFHFPVDHVIAYTTADARLAEVELVLDQPPRVLTQSSPGGRPLPPRQVTAGVVTRVKTWDGWRPASGNILVQVLHPNPALAFGQRVVVLGHLDRPDPAMNPGQFDWARYYRDQRTLASITAPESGDVRVVKPAGLNLVHALRERARAALAAGFAERHSVDHALLRALLLGDSDPQLRDVQADFQRTGTSHHLSISGMHVAVLGGVVFFLCRLVRLSPRVSAAVMMAFVVLYGLVALPAPPVLRSIILCLTFGVGVMLRRSVDGVQLLALTVFAMLVLHPLDLYNAGFQLSFLTVLGLMLYATRLLRRLDRRDEDERVLFSLGIAPSRMQSIRKWLKSHLLEGLSAGLVAWAVSAPLIVEHFDQLNPWAVPAGMLLAIPVFLSMIGGLLKVVLTLGLPWLAPLWAWLAVGPVESMRLGVAWLAKVPGSDMPLPAIPVALVLLYYACLALPLIPTARTRLKWVFRGGAATACACALMLPLLIGFAPRGGGGRGLRLTLLSVGAGQCAVVELPSGKTILIDAGSTTITDLHRRCLEPFLRHRGVGRVDAVFVSHANFDHFSAVAQLAEAYQPREVLFTPQFAKHAAKNYPARLLLRRLADLQCPAHQVSAGQTLDLGEGCELSILWPPAAAAALDENNSCQVMRLTYRGRSILFTGDIQAPAESALLAAGPGPLRSDVLIAPHHGSAEATTARFLDAVAAPTILASDDRTPSGKQREFDKLAAGRQLLRTHDRGAITVRVDPAGQLTLDTFRHP